MDFREYLSEHIKKHPSIMPQDVAKACYQAALGAEHLLSDISAAKRYFDAEFEATEARDCHLFERLSDDVCRVDLGAWKATGMPQEWLFNMFVGTATIKHYGKEKLEEYITCAEDLLCELEIGFSLEEWSSFLREYKSAGLPAIHHSGKYRESERPAYRIVDCRFLDCLPVLLAASKIENDDADLSKVIAIDGRAASGKSTLADKLALIIGADVVRMDDFFLPMDLRTPQRLDEVGGNLHYERFIEEVIPCVGKRRAFSYRVFDCSQMSICGDRQIGEGEWRIVEGSYSHHPKFGDYAHLKVFCSVSEEEQMRRILCRNGDKMWSRFKNEWIPMEEKYFDAFDVRKSALVLT